MSSSPKYIPLIEEVSIQNFKGISNCEIRDVGKINLLIGRNSCGKSSILEAIYFTGKEFLGGNLPTCIRRRADRPEISARELWYRYNMDSYDIKVKVVFNRKNFVQMVVRFLPEEGRLRTDLASGHASGSAGLMPSSTYEVRDFTHKTRRNIEIASPHRREIRSYFDRSIFVDPTIKRSITQIEGRYLNIIRLSEEISADLVKRTADIYEIDPSWEFLPHPDFSPNKPSRFAILEEGNRLFFDNFGDGLHYGLAVLAIAKTNTNSVLFIEEIESHQHPLAIKNLISNLLDIAESNNLQLFITSHNQNVWRYLYYHYPTDEERKKDFRCFHIIRDKRTGQVEARKEEGMINIQEDLYGRPQ